MLEIAMPKPTEHTWRERTAEGELRMVRASRHVGRWRLSSKGQDDEGWVEEDPISEEDLRSLRDVLWRKYQRRRLPWEHVREIDKLLGEDEA